MRGELFATSVPVPWRWERKGIERRGIPGDTQSSSSEHLIINNDETSSDRERTRAERGRERETAAADVEERRVLRTKLKKMRLGKWARI